MDGFDIVFPELAGREDREMPADLEPMEQQDAAPQPEGERDPAPEGGTIAFKRDHRTLQLPLQAVQALAEPLGLTPQQAVDTLQKGCNYDRMVKRASAAAGQDLEALQSREQGWVEFFMDHREVQPSDITEEMYARVERGCSPGEAYLQLQLKDARLQLEELRSRAFAAGKSPGGQEGALPEEPQDEFESAFDRALSFS